jgi:preprotein translocase subunit SecA
VDEADSLLIDEARVPLVIAGAATEEATSAAAMARLVAGLEPGLTSTRTNTAATSS